MKTIQKTLTGILAMICLLITLQLKAQDRYSYATFEKYDLESKTKYLVISMPVRNWYGNPNGEMTDQEKKSWNASFRSQANSKTGIQLMEGYQEAVPYRGDYNYFTSESDCREGITKEVNEFNRTHKNAAQYKDGEPGGKSYYKVIYVHPSKR